MDKQVVSGSCAGGPDLVGRLREELDRGEKSARDPLNANLPPLVLRVTTIYSPWFARNCPFCKDSFRERDQVRACPECQRAYHDDAQYGLHCWQEHFASGRCCREGGDPRFGTVEPCPYRWDGVFPDQRQMQQAPPAPPPALIRQFLSGLQSVWRPFGARSSMQVPRGSQWVGRPCPWCRHRVRAGDWVVLCPDQCGTCFHQDVFRHLTCWNAWNGPGGKRYCPCTGKPYKDPADDGP